ncbi:MAG: D-alanine--D-alanine ligase [Gammaproteobacteria bacterium]|nr:D-alanine--D-alanine ligase [Gammaproteobacteria bacterium]
MMSPVQQEQFGKVAVLMGGLSAEREISLKSGSAVLAALQRRGVNAHGVDVGHDVLQQLADGNFDRVFNILHGRGGEDGTMQGALEIIGLPYTGSGVMASAISMDKLRTKQLWQGIGLPTPAFEVLTDNTDLDAVVKQLGLPLMIKPALEGSSIGMSKVEKKEQMTAAYQTAAEYDDCVLAEKWITGSEYTASILGQEALPLIKLETPREFYDYEAKYQSDTTRYLCPCGLDSDKEQEIQALAMSAFKALGCSGWGRVDFMCDETGQPWLIEANTIPGMTDHSLVPMAARTAGIDFDELVVRILQTSMTNSGHGGENSRGGVAHAS